MAATQSLVGLNAAEQLDVREGRVPLPGRLGDPAPKRLPDLLRNGLQGRGTRPSLPLADAVRRA